MKSFERINGGLENVSCNLCGGDDEAVLFSDRPFRIVRCRSCNLIYSNPRPTEKWLKSYRLREGEGELLGYFDEEVVKKKSAKYLYLLSKLRELGLEGGKLLDFGCGIGGFLDIARKNSWETFGVDSSEVAVRIARTRFGLAVFKSLDSASFPSAYFDVVSLWDSIEHLSNPLGVLKELRKLVKKNGVLFIYTPNIDFHKLVAFITRNNGRLVPYEHLYHFSTNTLRRLVIKAGFNDVRIIPNKKLYYPDPKSKADVMLFFAKYAYQMAANGMFYLTRGSVNYCSSISLIARRGWDV